MPTVARPGAPVRMGSFSMEREATCSPTFPYPLQRGTFSRSSTSSTVSTVSSLSAQSDVSSTSTLIEPSECGLNSKFAGGVHDDSVCESCGEQLPPLPAPTSGINQAQRGSDLSLKPLLAGIKMRLGNQIAELGRPPRIVGLLATADEGCVMYAAATKKACTSNGLDFETRQLGGPTSSFETVMEAIESSNADLSLDGLIVYFPLFGPEQDARLRASISPRIDVEGVHPHNLLISSLSAPSQLEEEEDTVYPCTPLGVVRILQSLRNVYDDPQPAGERLAGKVISVVNRSETVGRPLALMLANEGAVVFSIDIASTQIYQKHDPSSTYCVRSSTCPMTPSERFAVSDIIISAVPSASYKIPTAQIKQGAIALNIATGNNFEDDVKDRAGLFVRRLGSVTTAMLMLNAVVLANRSKH